MFRKLATKYWYLLGLPLVPIVIMNLGATSLSTADQISTAEETYFQANGKYLQILKGSNLPPNESGTVKGKFGKDIAPEFYVYVYKTPKNEQGYQIFWEDNNNFYSRGYGPEASSRTQTIPKDKSAVNIASTTP